MMLFCKPMTFCQPFGLTPSLPGEIAEKWLSGIINDDAIIRGTFLEMFCNPHV